MKFIEELKEISKEKNKKISKKIINEFKEQYLIQYKALPFQLIPNELKQELHNKAEKGLNTCRLLEESIYSGEEIVFPVDFGNSLIKILESNNTSSNFEFIHKVVDNPIKLTYSFAISTLIENIPMALQVKYNVYRQFVAQTLKITPYFKLKSLIENLKKEGFEVEEKESPRMAVIDGVVTETKIVKISW